MGGAAPASRSGRSPSLLLLLTCREVLTSLRRFYSNAYTDAEKQDSLNL